MSELSTRELMNQLTDKLILDLKENERLCPTCKGLRFILVERGNHSYIENCRDCHTGKVYVCKHCGNTSPTRHCDCEGVENERRLEEKQKELERFNKAEKIKFNDYDGMFIFDEGHVLDKESFYNKIYDLIYYSEKYPTYIYATEKEYVSIGVDLIEEITNRCNDNGYEDMDSYVDFDNDKLTQAQNLIDEWVGEQESVSYVYYEDHRKVVLLDKLIEEIKNKIKTNKEN
jgi:hypothetical protein